MPFRREENFFPRTVTFTRIPPGEPERELQREVQQVIFTTATLLLEYTISDLRAREVAEANREHRPPQIQTIIYYQNSLVLTNTPQNPANGRQIRIQLTQHANTISLQAQIAPAIPGYLLPRIDIRTNLEDADLHNAGYKVVLPRALSAQMPYFQTQCLNAVEQSIYRFNKIEITDIPTAIPPAQINNRLPQSIQNVLRGQAVHLINSGYELASPTATERYFMFTLPVDPGTNPIAIVPGAEVNFCDFVYWFNPAIIQQARQANAGPNPNFVGAMAADSYQIYMILGMKVSQQWAIQDQGDLYDLPDSIPMYYGQSTLYLKVPNGDTTQQLAGAIQNCQQLGINVLPQPFDGEQGMIVPGMDQPLVIWKNPPHIPNNNPTSIYQLKINTTNNLATNQIFTFTINPLHIISFSRMPTISLQKLCIEMNPNNLYCQPAQIQNGVCSFNFLVSEDITSSDTMTLEANFQIDSNVLLITRPAQVTIGATNQRDVTRLGFLCDVTPQGRILAQGDLFTIVFRIPCQYLVGKYRLVYTIYATHCTTPFEISIELEFSARTFMDIATWQTNASFVQYFERNIPVFQVLYQRPPDISYGHAFQRDVIPSLRQRGYLNIHITDSFCLNINQFLPAGAVQLPYTIPNTKITMMSWPCAIYFGRLLDSENGQQNFIVLGSWGIPSGDRAGENSILAMLCTWTTQQGAPEQQAIQTLNTKLYQFIISDADQIDLQNVPADILAKLIRRVILYHARQQVIQPGTSIHFPDSIALDSREIHGDARHILVREMPVRNVNNPAPVPPVQPAPPAPPAAVPPAPPEAVPPAPPVPDEPAVENPAEPPAPQDIPIYCVAEPENRSPWHFNDNHPDIVTLSIEDLADATHIALTKIPQMIGQQDINITSLLQIPRSENVNQYRIHVRAFANEDGRLISIVGVRVQDCYSYYSTGATEQLA